MRLSTVCLTAYEQAEGHRQKQAEAKTLGKRDKHEQKVKTSQTRKQKERRARRQTLRANDKNTHFSMRSRTGISIHLCLAFED